MPAAITDNADGVASIDHRLLAQPLEFILADHLRQRHLCALVERLAETAQLDSRLAEIVADHIAGDMAIHVIDEEEDLFPLLRRRAQAGDDVERVLGLLSREHAEDDRLAEAIVAGLRHAGQENACALDSGLRAILRAFARRQRRHLAVENAIVMPLAEARLTAKDRDGLARRMAVRRGIHLPPGARP